MLLETSFDLWEEGRVIRQAVESCLNAGFATKDINSQNAYGTTEVGDKIISFIG